MSAPVTGRADRSRRPTTGRDDRVTAAERGGWGRARARGPASPNSPVSPVMATLAGRSVAGGESVFSRETQRWDKGVEGEGAGGLAALLADGP
jgi:hypothetical protein